MLLTIINSVVSPRYFFRAIKGALSKDRRRVEINEGDRLLVAIETRDWVDVTVYRDSHSFELARDWKTLVSIRVPIHEVEKIRAVLITAFELLTPTAELGEAA